MIDYKKLDYATELVLKTDLWFEFEIGRNTQDEKKPWIHYRLIRDGGEVIYEDSTIDSVIERLKKFKKSKPKYEIGDKVCVLERGKFVFEKTIKRSEAYKGSWLYTMSSLELYEEYFCYPSREALIEAQLKYWHEMAANNSNHPTNKGELQVCKHCGMKTATPNSGLGGNPNCNHDWIEVDETECEHEPSDEMYLSNPPVNKCKHCGEFYR